VAFAAADNDYDDDDWLLLLMLLLLLLLLMLLVGMLAVVVVVVVGVVVATGAIVGECVGGSGKGSRGSEAPLFMDWGTDKGVCNRNKLFFHGLEFHSGKHIKISNGVQ
jgi:hypothetical protein